MIFSNIKTKSSKQRQIRKMEFENTINSNNEIIQNRLKEALVVDKQLAQVISDTKELTTQIQAKLDSKLKITRSTLKSLCHNIREGMIISNYLGKVIETNKAFEDSFSLNDSAVGMNFIQICEKLNPMNEDGTKYELTQDFKALSKTIFKFKHFNAVIQSELVVEICMPGKNPFKCMFSVSVLDNSPERVEDICYVLFFKCFNRRMERDRRAKARAV